MTGDKLMQGISATKTINDIVLTLAENEENKAYCKRIQGCLHTITDVLEDVVVDMIKMEEISNKLAEMNAKLENHLKNLK